MENPASFIMEFVSYGKSLFEFLHETNCVTLVGLSFQKHILAE